jgi:lipopolysaccharide export system protein LptC
MSQGNMAHDWSARARSTALQALRYTQFVGVMKRALPAAAFAVIAAVLAFFFVQRQPAQLAMTYEKMGRLQNDLTMAKPRLTGVDQKGNPFVITADAAIQDPTHPKRARLTKVQADLQTPKGWLNAEAGNGAVDMVANTLELSGGIAIYSDQGYELHTRAASVDLKEGVVHGHDEVRGQGPLGTMRADQFHFDRASNQLTLHGHVRTVIIGKRT